MTAGRKPLAMPQMIEPEADMARAGEGFDLMRDQQLGAIARSVEAEQHVRAVALQVGYQLPADCIDPDLIQRDISANMRRSVEACLEVGRGLAVLKAACEHGQFLARLDVLGVDRKVAAKFMQAATKFTNVSSTRHLLEAAGNQTKLFELLVLDDDQVEELELTGQTGELKLDEIAAMSVKELRAALREARAELKATEEISAEKTQRIEALQRETKRIAAAAPDKVLAELQSEAARMANDLRGGIVGQLRQALVALHTHGNLHSERPLVFMAGLVGQLEQDLLALRDEFGLPTVDRGELAWVDEA